VAQTTSFQHLAEHAAEFDIIHFHIDWMHFPLVRQLQVPFLTTLHGRLDLPGLAALVSGFPDAPFVSISESQRAALPEANWASTVYHGMPPDLLSPCREPDDYLAFLGRLSPEKGAEAAIRIARHANMPLRISAKVPRDGSRYFKEKIEQQLDDQIRLRRRAQRPREGTISWGSSGAAVPNRLARAVRARNDRSNGIGTPVIAFRHGSVPEVIEHRTSGFVVDGEAEAVAALARIEDLDRHQVRRAFERRFTTRRMTDNYLLSYRNLLNRVEGKWV
jgi:glycosyltransferase involved in cell wall biosynthesis